MKNRLLIFIYTILLCSNAFAEELFIEAKDITLNKEKKTSIFQNDVLVKTTIEIKNARGINLGIIPKIFKNEYLK